jgi:hypothetical protein
MNFSNPRIDSDLQPTKNFVTLNCDNQGAIKLAYNPVFHARTKHVKIHYHFIWERVLEGEIHLQYINTRIQPADLLMKSLGHVKFETHRQALGLYKLDSLQR